MLDCCFLLFPRLFLQSSLSRIYYTLFQSSSSSSHANAPCCFVVRVECCPIIAGSAKSSLQPIRNLANLWNVPLLPAATPRCAIPISCKGRSCRLWTREHSNVQTSPEDHTSGLPVKWQAKREAHEIWTCD